MKNYPLTTKVLDDYHRWVNDISTGPYRPYLTVRSFNSAGTCSIIWSRKTGRNHHLLSQGELRAFIFIESLSRVIDIREQYALHPEHTLAIAEQLGIRHRRSNKLRSILPMTTDFLVQCRIGSGTQWIAFAYKPTNILTLPNPKSRIRSAINGLRIEETHWQHRDVPWQLRYEAQLPRVVIYNIEFFRSYSNLNLAEEAKITNFHACFSEIWAHQPTMPLQKLIYSTGATLQLDRPSSLNVFKYLAWHRRFPIDLSQQVELYLPLPLLRSARS